MSKRKLIPFVDYYPLKNFKERVKPKNLQNEPTILPKGTIDKNSWKDVITYCQLHSYKPSDIYKLIFDRHRPKTTEATIKIGILVYDKLQLNKKKKKSMRLPPRAVILNSRKDIIKLSKNKNPTNLQLYRIGNKSLLRAPQFLLLNKAERKKFGY